MSDSPPIWRGDVLSATVRDDEIRRAFTNANPWWGAAAARRDPLEWTESHRLLRERGTHDLGYRSQVLADLAREPVCDALILLTGPRRVGKSVVLVDLAASLCGRSDVDPRQVIHLPCDGMRDRDLRRALTLGRDLTRVVDRKQATPRVWLLDEVSGVRGWTAVLKAARDGTAFGADTVVVTGSRWQRDEDVEGHLLAGRAGSGGARRVRHLLPMTFRDFLTATRPELAQPSSVHPADLQVSDVAAAFDEVRFDIDRYDLAWQDYLSSGGFPRAVAERARLGDVSDGFCQDLLAWLRRDVDPDSAPESLPLLLDHVTTRMTSPLSVRATAEELSGSRRSTTTGLNRLVSTFAAIWVPQHSDNGRPLENAQSKIYLTDPLLAWLPSRVRAGLHAPDMTTLSEATIGVALARAIDDLDEGRWVAGDTIGYVRTGSGNEIDFGPVALPSAAGTRWSTPVESKWVDSGWRAEAQALEKKYARGVLATKSILDTDHLTWAVPAALVALLLG